MTSKDRVLARQREEAREKGYNNAMALQVKSADMTGTELNARQGDIPDFAAACLVRNMLYRGTGFVCRSSGGRVVRLVQNYDSDIFTQEPEELPAQWGFAWSKDPAHALPFVAISTSPYMTGDVCEENGLVYASVIDNNVWPPSGYPQGWRLIEA